MTRDTVVIFNYFFKLIFNASGQRTKFGNSECWSKVVVFLRRRGPLPQVMYMYNDTIHRYIKSLSLWGTDLNRKPEVIS